MKNQSRETTHCNILTERVGITYPLIQGAMAGISTADFVSEVSKTGILGTLSTYGLSPEECLKEIRQLKKAQRPFACNLMLQQPNVDQLLEIILAEKVKIVTLSAGYRPDFVKQLKAAGVIVLAVVGSPEQAKKMMHVAVDFLIAEGSESGGHIGSYRREELRKFLAENATIPYIVAGGIHDDRGFQKALEQGASGVQIGTPLLLTMESPLPEQQKIALVQAKTDAVMVQTKESGLALRGVLVDGDLVPCGVSTGLISDILSLEERVHQIVEGHGR